MNQKRTGSRPDRAKTKPKSKAPKTAKAKAKAKAQAEAKAPTQPSTHNLQPSAKRAVGHWLV